MSQVDVNVSKKKKAGKTKMTQGTGPSQTQKERFIKAFGDNTFFGAGKSMGMGDKLLAQYKSKTKKT
tara:strand:- start:735 stop:935 length:201 start_codon:yes stop_codon:yes gene_type:complete